MRTAATAARTALPYLPAAAALILLLIAVAAPQSPVATALVNPATATLVAVWDWIVAATGQAF